jgi:hypothetical protein
VYVLKEALSVTGLAKALPYSWIEQEQRVGLLQNRKAEAGSIARVPAPETENLVCDGVRRHLAAMGKEPPAGLDGAAPLDFTVTSLAKALPYSWAEQERTILRNT